MRTRCFLATCSEGVIQPIELIGELNCVTRGVAMIGHDHGLLNFYNPWHDRFSMYVGTTDPSHAQNREGTGLRETRLKTTFPP